MREVFGDLWSYLGRKDFRICLTTNGTIKNDGTAVMGAGCARQAVDRFPDLPMLLGRSLKFSNNRVVWLTPEILAFPVKHEWHEKANIKLITKSTEKLKSIAESCPDKKFILPRPGCGNGGLKWSKVKPIVAILPNNVFLITNEVK